MPLVAKGSQAPTPTRAPTPVSVQPTPTGPLSAISSGPSSIHALTPIQAVAPHPFQHNMAPPSFIGAPVNRLLQAASAPVMSVGSLIRGHPLEALRHLAAIPADIASIPIPQLKDLYNRIPGLKEHEFVLPSQALHERGILPGGTLGSVLGFGADVLADPLTYALPGVGGVLERGAETGLRAAEDAAARHVAEVVARPVTDPGRLVDLLGAQREAEAAKLATRAARGPGARLSVGVGGTRFGKELGTIPGTPAISRAVGKGVGKLTRGQGVQDAITGFQEHFLTGGLERNLPQYRALTQLRRAINAHEGELQRANDAVAQQTRKAVVKMGRAGATDPTGKPWSFESLEQQITDHIEQPEKFPLPQAAQFAADKRIEMNKLMKDIEHANFVDYTALPNYMTHRMRTPAGRDAFIKFANSPANAARSPYFVKDERFPTNEAIRNATATPEDVLLGRAAKVGDNLGLDPETSVSKLMQARIRAHGQALMDATMRQESAARAGLKPPSPVDVQGVEGLRGISEESDAALRELQRPTDLKSYTAAVTSRLAQRRGAELGLRVAKRPAPALAARERAGRALAAAEGRVEAGAQAERVGRGVLRGAQRGARVAARQPNLSAQMRAARALHEALGGADIAQLQTIPEIRALAEQARVAAEAGRGATAAKLARPSRYTRVTLPESGKEVRLAPRAKRARRASPSVVPREARAIPSTARGRQLMRQYFKEQGPLTAAEKAAHKEALTAERTVLRTTRGAVEKARKGVLSAMRSRDPVAIRQAREMLGKAQRDHIAARIEHAVAREARKGVRGEARVAARAADPLAVREAQRGVQAAGRSHVEALIERARAQGTFAGTAPQVRIATRKAGVARSRLNLALSDQQRVERVRAELARLPGREATPEEWHIAQKGLEKYASAGIRGAKGRVQIPPEEQRVIQRVTDDINASMPDPNARAPIEDFLRKVTSHWKVLALVSPGYHLRNAYGDSIGAWWAGARNPISFIQAARIIKNQDNPEKLRAMKLLVNGRMMTGEELLHESRAMGIHGQGFIGTELGKAQPARYDDEQTALRKRLSWAGKIPGLRHLPGEGPASRISGKVGQMREDSTRLGTYLDLRKQGKSIVDAAEKTHTFLFDYGHVSKFVAKARRFWMPFITYTSKAVPRTLKMAATRPGYFSHHAELANALSTAAGIAPGGPSNLPVGQRSAFGIPDPGGILHRILGMPADQPIIWNPQGISPWGSLNSLDPTQIQRGPVSNLLNPFVKTATELGTGHRFFYAGNAPKRSVAPPLIGALHSLGIPIPNFGPKLSQAVGHDVGGYSSTLDELLRNLPAFSMAAGINPEDPEGMRRSLASYLGGLPLQSYDRAQLLANAQKYGGK